METIPSPTPERNWNSSVMSDSLRLFDFPGKSTGVGCHFLLQGIFPTQGSNPGLPHCRQTLYPLSHQEAPTIAVSYFRHVSFSFPSSLLCTYIHFWSCTVWSWTTETKKMLLSGMLIDVNIEMLLNVYVCLSIYTQSSLLELQSHTLHWTLAIKYCLKDLRFLLHTKSAH